MIYDNFEIGELSDSMRSAIASYYIELYENYEMQTICTIAKNLHVHHKTIQKFINSSLQNYSADKMFVIVLLCTKFSTRNKYYELQQKFKKIIKRREFQKNLRQFVNSRNQTEEKIKVKKM